MNKALIFYHIPKTAGSSLNNYISAHFAPEKTLWLQQHKYGYLENDLKVLSEEILTSFDYFSGHYNFGLIDRIQRDKMIFTIIRDPYDRTYSNYKHFKRTYSKPEEIDLSTHTTKLHKHLYQRFAIEKIGYEEFIRDEFFQKHYIVNVQTRLLATQDKMPPKSLEYCYSNEIYYRALERLELLDFIGITDKFDEFIELLCYKMHWFPYRLQEKANVIMEKDREELTEDGQWLLDSMLAFDMQIYMKAKEKFQLQYAEIGSLQNYISALYDGKENDVVLQREDLYFGRGWYSLETGFSWTGPETLSEVLIPNVKKEQTSLLIIEINRFRKVDSLFVSSIKLVFNGKRVKHQLEYVESTQKYILTAILKPENYTSDLTNKLQIKIKGTISPFEQEINDDRRKLGVSVSNIKYLYV